jgi:branched-subunit amino acid transport protein AzlD
MNQPTVLYMLSAVVISGIITFLLRVLPFAVLSKLRASRFVRAMGKWMPVGILLILVVITVSDIASSTAQSWWIAAVSLVVTIAVHLLTRRKTGWSIAAGTACYVILVNIFS